jgi:hypothetical protein
VGGAGAFGWPDDRSHHGGPPDEEEGTSFITLQRRAYRLLIRPGHDPPARAMWQTAGSDVEAELDDAAFEHFWFCHISRDDNEACRESRLTAVPQLRSPRPWRCHPGKGAEMPAGAVAAQSAVIDFLFP